MRDDAYFMKIAIEQSMASRDPMNHKRVGCVIVKDDEIISTGSRQVFQITDNPYTDITFHAEHIAIIKARWKARGATMYCTLEPCTFRSYTLINATPPPPCCCELIRQAGIKRLVYLDSDNELGSGGTKVLSYYNIEVTKLKL